MTTDNDIFDLEIRSLVENAEAEVPEGAWTAVSAALGKTAKPFPLWRYVAVAAAAAAVVAGVFFGLRTPSVPVDSLAPTLVAASVPETVETVAEEPVVALVEPEGEAPVLAMMTEPARRPGRPAPRKSVPTQEINAETASDTAFEPMPESPQTPAETIPTETSEVSPVSGETPHFEIVDPFEGLVVTESTPRRHSLLSVDFSSNSSYGGKPGPFIPPMRAPGRPTSTMVREAPGDSEYALPVTAGIGIRFSFGPSKRFGIGTGIEYTRLSRKFEGQYLEFTDGVQTRELDGEITNTQQYIGVPLNFYVDVLRGERFGTYVFAGATAEKCVDNRFRIPDGNDYAYWHPKADGLQLSAGAGLGVQYRLSPSQSKPQWMLFAQPDVRYFFDCDQPKSIRTQQPLQVSLTLGIRLGF